jgi:hypothetical protein
MNSFTSLKKRRDLMGLALSWLNVPSDIPRGEATQELVAMLCSMLFSKASSLCMGITSVNKSESEKSTTCSLHCKLYSERHGACSVTNM